MKKEKIKYNQKFVDIIDYNEFLNKLKNWNLKIDLQDKLANSMMEFVSYQHAFLKCVTNKEVRDLAIAYINEYYEYFTINPHYFATSPLIDNDVIDMYANDEWKENVKQTKRVYYNKEKVARLFDKAVKDEISQSKFAFYSCLLRYYKEFSTKYDIDALAKMLIKKYKSIDDMQEMERRFLAYYFTNYGIKDPNLICDVYITNEPKIIRCNALNGLVTINIDGQRILPIEDFAQACCYASSLNRTQEKTTDNNYTFEMAIEQLFAKYLKKEQMDIYMNCYKQSGLNTISEDKGYDRAAAIFKALGEQNLCDLLINKKASANRNKGNPYYNNDRDYQSFILTSNSMDETPDYPADTFIVKRLDEIIKNNPEELKKYPILKKFYNPDGARKSFNKMINLWMNENVNFKHIYDIFISFDINEGKIASDKGLSIPASRDERIKLFTFLAKLNESKTENLKKFIFNSDDYTAQELRDTLLYQINQISNILLYVKDHMNELVDVVSSNSKILDSYIKPFFDYDIGSIRNEAINKDNFIMYGLNSLKHLNRELITEFNGAYNKKMIEEKEELSIKGNKREKILND